MHLAELRYRRIVRKKARAAAGGSPVRGSSKGGRAGRNRNVPVL